MPALSTSSTVALTSASIVGATIVAGATMGLFSKNQMPVDGKTVLLTGASEGMGRSVAKQLSAQGANLIVVARNVGRLEETVNEIKSLAKSPEQRFHYIAADVAQPDYARAVVADALAWNAGAPIDVVWCVAGMSTPMLWLEEPHDVAIGASRRNMDVNFWGAAEMAHAILAEWRTSPYTEPRHLVFTASVLAFYAVVGYAPYTPSKWALRGLADTLHQETQLYYKTHPVRVAVVYPGTILSPGLTRENQTKPEITLQLEKDDPKMTPDDVAAEAIAGLQRGDHFVTVSLLGRLMRWSVLGGSPRNNAVLDTLGGWAMVLIFFFVQWWMNGDIRAYARKHGNPSTFTKKK